MAYSPLYDASITAKTFGWVGQPLHSMERRCPDWAVTPPLVWFLFLGVPLCTGLFVTTKPLAQKVLESNFWAIPDFL